MPDVDAPVGVACRWSIGSPARWGSEPHDDGKVVWFEIDRTNPDQRPEPTNHALEAELAAVLDFGPAAEHVPRRPPFSSRPRSGPTPTTVLVVSVGPDEKTCSGGRGAGCRARLRPGGRACPTATTFLVEKPRTGGYADHRFGGQRGPTTTKAASGSKTGTAPERLGLKSMFWGWVAERVPEIFCQWAFWQAVIVKIFYGA